MPLFPRARAAEQFAELLDGRSTATSPHLLELADVVRRLSSIPPPTAPPGLKGRALQPPPTARSAASPGPRSTVRALGNSPRASAREANTRTVVSVAPCAPAFLRLAAAVVATVLVLGGIAFGSTRAMPGDTLYGVKRGIEDVNVSLAANDVTRDRAKLDAAEARMSELQHLRREGRLGVALTPETAHQVAGLLQDWADAAVSGATDLLHRSDPDARSQLSHFVSEQSALLAALRPLLPAADLQKLSGGAAAFLAQLQPAIAPSGPSQPGRVPRSAPIPLGPASTRPATATHALNVGASAARVAATATAAAPTPTTSVTEASGGKAVGVSSAAGSGPAPEQDSSAVSSAVSSAGSAAAPVLSAQGSPVAPDIPDARATGRAQPDTPSQAVPPPDATGSLAPAPDTAAPVTAAPDTAPPVAALLDGTAPITSPPAAASPVAVPPVPAPLPQPSAMAPAPHPFEPVSASSSAPPDAGPGSTKHLAKLSSPAAVAGPASTHAHRPALETR